jgi:hypothetical protein
VRQRDLARHIAQRRVAEPAVLPLVAQDRLRERSQVRASGRRQDREGLEVAPGEVAAELPEPPPAVERHVGQDEVARVLGPAAAGEPLARQANAVRQLAGRRRAAESGTR